jgi:hypothetical protein
MTGRGGTLGEGRVTGEISDRGNHGGRMYIRSPPLGRLASLADIRSPPLGRLASLADIRSPPLGRLASLARADQLTSMA